jgi:predicted MFS family arabinose efflux permease
MEVSLGKTKTGSMPERSSKPSDMPATKTASAIGLRLALGKKTDRRSSHIKTTPLTTLLRRLDIAEWNRVHIAITAALGVGWLLDAFEVTIVNNVIGTFRNLWHLTNLQASWILSIWFVGIMAGAYVFGYLADRFGRRRCSCSHCCFTASLRS